MCDKFSLGIVFGTFFYFSDGCGTDGLRSRVKYGVKIIFEVCGVVGFVVLCVFFCVLGMCEVDRKLFVFGVVILSLGW